MALVKYVKKVFHFWAPSIVQALVLLTIAMILVWYAAYSVDDATSAWGILGIIVAISALLWSTYSQQVMMKDIITLVWNINKFHYIADYLQLENNKANMMELEATKRTITDLTEKYKC